MVFLQTIFLQSALEVVVALALLVLLAAMLYAILRGNQKVVESLKGKIQGAKQFENIIDEYEQSIIDEEDCEKRREKFKKLEKNVPIWKEGHFSVKPPKQKEQDDIDAYMKRQKEKIDKDCPQ